MLRNNTIKSLMALVFVVILIVGTSGCLPKRVPGIDTGRELMMQYMNQKYGENFTFVEIERFSHGFGIADTMIVTSEAFPDEVISVAIGYARSSPGEDVLRDDYEQVRLRDDIEAELAPLVDAVYGETCIFLSPQRNEARTIYSPDMNAAEYLRDIDTVYSLIYVFVSKDVADKDSDVEAFRKALETNQYPLTFKIVYVNGYTLANLTRENSTKYNSSVVEEVHAIGHFEMDSSFNFAFSQWFK